MGSRRIRHVSTFQPQRARGRALPTVARRGSGMETPRCVVGHMPLSVSQSLPAGWASRYCIVCSIMRHPQRSERRCPSEVCPHDSRADSHPLHRSARSSGYRGLTEACQWRTVNSFVRRPGPDPGIWSRPISELGASLASANVDLDLHLVTPFRWVSLLELEVITILAEGQASQRRARPSSGLAVLASADVDLDLHWNTLVGWLKFHDPRAKPGRFTDVASSWN